MEYKTLKEIVVEQLKEAEAAGDIVIVTPAEQALIKRICDGIYPYLEGAMSQEEMNGVVGILREVLYGTRFYDSEMEHSRVGVPREVLENYLRKLPPPVLQNQSSRHFWRLLFGELKNKEYRDDRQNMERMDNSRERPSL